MGVCVYVCAKESKRKKQTNSIVVTDPQLNEHVNLLATPIAQPFRAAEGYGN